MRIKCDVTSVTKYGLKYDIAQSQIMTRHGGKSVMSHGGGKCNVKTNVTIYSSKSVSKHGGKTMAPHVGKSVT